VRGPAAGAWTPAYGGELEPLVDALAESSTAARSVSIDMARVDGLDAFGAWLLERVLGECARDGRQAEVVGLREHHRGLVEKVRAASRIPVPPAVRPNPVLATLEYVGRVMVGVGADTVLLVQM